MKVVVCDGCERELSNRKTLHFERYDTVSLTPQERLDLCDKCYPHFGALQEKRKVLGAKGLQALDEREKQYMAEFWEAVKRGATTP
jgi:hypothetical protein